MKLLSLQDALESFLQQPTPARFVVVRDFVIGEIDYRPCPLTLVELTNLLRDAEYDQLLRRIETLMPAWAICPRVHFLAGCAAQAVGDCEEVELCRFLSSTCIQGIRNSGDGSRRRPWLVTYPSDVQDCLASLALSVTSQRLVEGDDALFDVVTTAGGNSYWFDVTEMVAADGEVFAPAPAMS